MFCVCVMCCGNLTKCEEERKKKFKMIYAAKGQCNRNRWMKLRLMALQALSFEMKEK